MDRKVCILSSVHPALDVRIFYREAKTLKNAGYKVVLLAQHAKDEIREGVRIVALAKPGNRLVRMLITTWKTFKLAFKENVDIYHFHDPELILVGLFLKIFKRTKVIYDVHEDVELDILSKYWLPKMLRLPAAKIFNLLEKSISKKFSYIITTTFHIRDKFKDCPVMDVKNYPVISPVLNRQRGIFGKQGCDLIYAGVLSADRGIKDVIGALSFVNSCQRTGLVLLGKFSDKGFEQQCRKLKNWNKIEFQGERLPNEVFEYLLKADIGIVCLHPRPNYIKALPNKMFEYMAAGLPVVASNFSLWKEIIKGNKCGICVDPLNPKEIAGAVEYLIKHPDEARKMGENGRKAVLKEYNWENESKRLLKVYRELTSGNDYDHNYDYDRGKR